MTGIIREEDRAKGTARKARTNEPDSARADLMLFSIRKRLPLIIEQTVDQARWWIRETPLQSVSSVTLRLPYGDVFLHAVHSADAQDLILTALQEVEPAVSSVVIGARDSEEYLRGIPVVICFNPALD